MARAKIAQKRLSSEREIESVSPGALNKIKIIFVSRNGNSVVERRIHCY